MRQIIRLIAVAMVACGATEALADEAVIACLQSKVLLTDPQLGDSLIGRSIAFDITNNLPYAISGLYYEARVTSDGRSVPWFNDTQSFSIPGGVEPGETRHIDGYSLPISRDAPQELTVELRTMDVADPEQRPVDAEVRFINWSADRSPLGCPG